MGRKAYKWVLRSWEPLTDLQAAADLLNTMRPAAPIEPQLLDGPAARRILAVAPHPDDEVIGPGGALIRARERGATVRVLYLTSGEPGEEAEREAEARAVCQRLGWEAEFLRFPVLAIPRAAAAEGLRAAVGAFRPGALLLPFALDDHPDHRLASALLLDAWRAGGLEGVEVWAYQVYTALAPNVVVDVTPEAARKAEAIRLYRTQMRRRDWAHFALGLNAFNCRLLRGRADPCYVEAYFVLPIHEYSALVDRFVEGNRR